MVSGEKTDKAGVFQVFYGSLKTAPMIRECPLDLGCRLGDCVGDDRSAGWNLIQPRK